MLSYEGIFFDKETVELIKSLDKKMLARVNDEIHCTFKYHPQDEEIFDDIVGKYFELYLIGYGNDGLNSGFQVLLPDELMPYYINYQEEDPTVLKTPHITSSLTIGASPTKTKDLHFIPLMTPIKIVGRFGYWIKDEEKGYLSFKPYFINKKK